MEATRRGAQAGAGRGQALAVILRKSSTRRGFLAKRRMVSATASPRALVKLKRSIHGTWHHVSPKHLGRYVDEATFRLNEGNCEVDTLDRMESFASGIGNRRIPYRKLTASNGLPSGGRSE